MVEILDGVRFISINDKLDNYDNPNFTVDLGFSLLNVVYEHYAVDISQKVSTVKHMQQEKGDFIGVSAPYGYLKDPKDCHKFIIDKYAANIVKRIFNLTLKCKGKSEIADILNKESVLPPSKYKCEVTEVRSQYTYISDEWNNDMVANILRNETYTGKLIQGRFRKPVRKRSKLVRVNKDEWKVVENHHKAIIDKDTFDTVQNIINFVPVREQEDELLLSKLECTGCKSGFYRKKSKNYYYYVCKSKYRKTGCNMQSIRKDILENMVLMDMNDKFKRDKNKLNKEIVDKYINAIKIYDTNKVEVVYK